MDFPSLLSENQTPKICLPFMSILNFTNRDAVCDYEFCDSNEHSMMIIFIILFGTFDIVFESM